MGFCTPCRQKASLPKIVHGGRRGEGPQTFTQKAKKVYIRLRRGGRSYSQPLSGRKAACSFFFTVPRVLRTNRCSSPSTSAAVTSTSARFPSRRRHCAGMWWSFARNLARPTATWPSCGGDQVCSTKCLRHHSSLSEPSDRSLLHLYMYRASSWRW